MKPISFALIGKEVLFSKLDAQLVGYGVVIVIVGSLVSLFFCREDFFFFENCILRPIDYVFFGCRLQSPKDECNLSVIVPLVKFMK